jgi:hypothetical protein
MPKRLQIAPHLPVAELERRYRQASEGIERSHYQIIWLLAQGRKSEDVATLTSYSRLWIYELVRSYNRCGPDALGDKHRENPGKSPLLNDVQQAQLWQALQDSPTDGDLWDGNPTGTTQRHPVAPARSLSAGKVSPTPKALSLQGRSKVGLILAFEGLNACVLSTGMALFVQNQKNRICL